MAIGAVVVLLAGAVALVLVERPRAEDALREYLGLIADGKVAEVLAATPPPKGADTRLLTPEVFATVTERLVVRSVEMREGDDGEPVAWVTAAVGGREELLPVRMRQEGGTFGSWRVVDPLLVPVAVYDEYFATATVGGVEVRTSMHLPSLDAVYEYLVLPGVYPVRAERSPHVADATASISALQPHRDANTSPGFDRREPLPAVADEILRQAREHAAGCSAKRNSCSGFLPQIREPGVVTQPPGNIEVAFSQRTPQAPTNLTAPFWTRLRATTDSGEAVYELLGNAELHQDGSITVTFRN